MTPETTAPAFSLVQDPLLKAQRFLRLAPRQGLGAVRRAVLLALFAWVPIAVWAAATERLYGGTLPEPLLAHFGVSLRCLVGIPLLILCEAAAEVILGRVIHQFAASGLVSEPERLNAVLRSTERLRDAWPPWVVIPALTLFAAVSGNVQAHQVDALQWALVGSRLGFGGQWFLLVARPIFLLLVLTWLWRLALLAILFRRIVALELRLSPSHPDRVGGLGFLEQAPSAFALMQMAMSTMLAGHVAHEILYHGGHIASLKAFIAVAVILVAILPLVPLFPFAASLLRVRAKARLDYGALASVHARGLHARWVTGGAVENPPLMAAPEIGSSADLAALHATATGMRPVPIGRNALVAVLLPAALPMLAAAMTDVPLKEILLKIVGALG